MNEYLYLWGSLLFWVGVTMLPICLVLGLLSAIIDMVWPEGGRK